MVGQHGPRSGSPGPAHASVHRPAAPVATGAVTPGVRLSAGSKRWARWASPSPIIGPSRSGGLNVELIQHDDSYVVQLDTRSVVHFSLPLLDGQRPVVSSDDVGEGWRRVRLTWSLDKPTQQDELAIPFDLDFAPDFWWAPHLAPQPGD